MANRSKAALFEKKAQKKYYLRLGIPVLGLVVIQVVAVLYSPSNTLSTLTLIAIEVLMLVGIVQLLMSSHKTELSELIALKGSLNRELFERQRLLSLINNMGEAVLATDEKGKVLLYNGAVLNLLDTNQTLEGKSIDKVLDLRDKKHNRIKILSLVEGRPVGVTSTDYIHQFKPNDQINVYINVSPIKLGFKEQNKSGYIILLRDITKEKSLEEERDEFISVISHELRTPVAIAEGNISNAIFMSGKEDVPKVVSGALKQAHDQVLFLASMINDLATLSRAERTDAPLEITEVDPVKLMGSLERDYANEAAIRKIKLHVTVAKDTKPLYTSELYLHEVLQNFFTNAIKYTKKGSIIGHVRSDVHGNTVFSIADTGIGLNKADQKRIFDKFFRSEDYRTRESSGTGLGLYVTAKLAHRLQAVIAVESELNKGSTFTITVPSLQKPRKHLDHT